MLARDRVTTGRILESFILDFRVVDGYRELMLVQALSKSQTFELSIGQVKPVLSKVEPLTQSWLLILGDIQSTDLFKSELKEP